MGNNNSALPKLKNNLKSIEGKRKILQELDLFILDNSIRETTVGQIRGHTLKNKWDIYNEVSIDILLSDILVNIFDGKFHFLSVLPEPL